MGDLSSSEMRPPRPDIGGRKLPIDGGVFHRPGYAPVVVDSSKESYLRVHQLLETYARSPSLDLFTIAALNLIPLDPDWRQAKQNWLNINSGKKIDLSSYITTDTSIDSPKPRSGAGPDDQALLVALILEKSIAIKNSGFKTKLKNTLENKLPSEVSVMQDHTDGHAYVVYQNDGGIFKFDPSHQDTKFTKLP